MRKKITRRLPALLALALATGPVFGEDAPGFSLTVDAIIEGVYAKANSGEFADNETAEAERFYSYAGDDALTFFNLKKENFDSSNLRLAWAYTGDYFGANITLAGDKKTVGETTASLSDIFNDYNAWVKVPLLGGKYAARLATGTGALRGNIDRFANFDDFCRANNSGFGVFTAAYDKNTGKLSMTGGDATNLQKDATGASAPVVNLDLSADLGFPLTLSAASGSLFTKQHTKGSTAVGGEYTTTTTNFALRLEAARIAGFVSAAAVYKYAGSSRDYDDPDSNAVYTENGAGGFDVAHHQAGIYVTLLGNGDAPPPRIYRRFAGVHHVSKNSGERGQRLHL